MRVKILKLEKKDIVTKAGSAMTLRELHGFTADMTVFKTLLGRGEPDLPPGDYEVYAEPYVTFDGDIKGGVKFRPVERAPK